LAQFSLPDAGHSLIYFRNGLAPKSFTRCFARPRRGMEHGESLQNLASYLL
jgi:hypothetical protein